MRSRNIVLAAAAMLTIGAAPGETPGQALSRCMTLKTSGQDNVDMARWIVRAFAANKDVGDFIVVNEQQAKQVDERMGKLVNRLLLVDCRAEARVALQGNAEEALGFAFGQLGERAGEFAMNDPNANAAMEKAFGSFDIIALRKLAREGEAN